VQGCSPWQVLAVKHGGGVAEMGDRDNLGWSESGQETLNASARRCRDAEDEGFRREEDTRSEGWPDRLVWRA
jgi:hypothetical protein